MATYYVRTDGLDTNTGTGPAANQAWKTIQKALGATGITGGDTVYIAPGKYVEAVTIGGTYSSATYVIGDPNALQFSGVTAGVVRVSGYASDNTTATITSTLISGTANNLKFSGLQFESSNAAGIVITGTNIGISKCQFVLCSGYHGSGTNGLCRINAPTSTAANALVEQCIFVGGRYGLNIVGQNVADTTVVRNCLIGLTQYGILSQDIQLSITNCYVYGCIVVGVYNTGNNSFPSSVRNLIIETCSLGMQSTNSTQLIESYIRYIACGATRSGVVAGTGSTTEGVLGIDFGYQRINGMSFGSVLGTQLGSINTSYGTATNAPSTDLFGNAWSGTSPDAGAITYKVAELAYQPSERNASTITIAPGSTSQSIELYLGSTGLTASTLGLSARYNRTRTASVSIPLVARTIAQAWTAGGFAEVDSTNMPGVYRLDIPDAALAAGADDVTIVVRGASGTNGAVMTVKLSSGGLTAAQTASAVWDAQVAGYNTALDFGGVINETRNVVGATEIYVQGVASDVWDELKVNHTIPNTFGDYLDTKVSTGADTARIQLRQGPFLIKQNAIDSVITEVNQFLSTVPNIEMVLIDSSGGSVSVAGATLVMRVRNQAGTAVVNNITPTVAYADGGVIRWTPNLSWNALTVTTAGTYRIVVERTMSGVTTTFGPFLVQLSSG